MKKIIPGVAALACAVLIGGCGSGSDSAAPTTNAGDKATQEVADGALLEIGDFPKLWDADGQALDLGQQKQELAECAGVSVSDIYDDGAVTAQSPTFEYVLDTTLSQTVSISDNAEWAETAFDVLTGERYIGCMADKLQDASDARPTRPGVTIGTVDSGPVEFPALGDEAAAFQLRLPMESGSTKRTGYTDTVVIRLGSALIELNATGFGDAALSSQELAEYASISLERLRAGL